MIYIQYQSETYMRVIAEPGIKQELSDYFEFFVPGYKFMPAFKNKMWDGKIRLFNALTGTIYVGLLPRVVKFLRKRGYECEIDDKFKQSHELVDDDFGYELAEKYGLPEEISLRDYQNLAVTHALNNRRGMMLSATGSGKSLIIYLLARYHIEKGRRVLLIVPTTALVFQMAKEFREYNREEDLPFSIHKILEGAKKDASKDLVISTWQSIYKQNSDWYNNFDVIIGDEAHQYKAKSLMNIMENASQVKHRYGFSGTLDDAKTHKLTLEGLYGPVKNVKKTADLIEEGTLSKFKINAILLKHPENACREISKYNVVDGKSKPATYDQEIKELIADEKRNKYICNLAHSLKGNTLILFQFVEKHGEVLYPMLQKEGKNVHFIHGKVAAEDREEVREIAESTGNNIILASYGTFSTGINIKRLDNVIFSSPSKSKIRNLQSIGRVLRKSEHGDVATLYDIGDDLRTGKRENFALRHFKVRLEQYAKENFEFRIYNVNL